MVRDRSSPRAVENEQPDPAVTQRAKSLVADTRSRALDARESEQDTRQTTQDAREEDLQRRETVAAANSSRRLDLELKEEQQVRREAEQDHREAAQDERQAEQNERERVGEMLIGMLSHDLRNPLSTISVGASLLMKGGSLSERDARTVARMARSADRMTRMIEQLLDLTRIRLGGGLVVNRQRINMYDLIEEVLDELRIVYADRDLVGPAWGNAVGSWDRDRMAAVLSNLVCNAVQYSAAGTPVVVALRGADHYLGLEVHNQGPPIARELLPVIFDPFRSGKKGTTGLGLGLYISKQIVVAHGGSMRVESEEGDGTTFYVKLPLGA